MSCLGLFQNTPRLQEVKALKDVQPHAGWPYG